MSVTPDQGQPSALRRALPRPVAVLCLLLLIGQALLLTVVSRSSQGAEPHELPIAVVASPVVAQSLADRANGLAGSPFRAYVARDAEAARESVRQGTTAAALDIDLRGTRDVLLLNKANGKDLNDAIRQRVDVVEMSYDRSVDVQLVDTAQGPARSPDMLALLAHGVAFLFVLVVSLALGPIPRTRGRGLLRHAALVAVAAVSGVALSLSPLAGDAPLLKVAGVLTLVAVVVGSGVIALEALAGLAGLGIALAVFFVQMSPLLLGLDTRLLPTPWRSLAQATPAGAAERSLSDLIAYADAPGPTRYVFVLGAWLAVALLVSVVARRARIRLGINPDLEPDPDQTHDVSRRARRVWRLRVAALVLPAAVLLVSVAQLAPRTAVAAPESIPTRASETRCVPTGPIRDVADLNRITTGLRGGDEFQHGFQGGDVGASVVLQDGRALFLFGDTLRADGYDGQQFVRNSMLVMERECLQVVTPADGGAIIPDRPGSNAGARVGYWPMSVGRVERPGHDLVVVSAQRVRSVGTGPFDFENLGPSLAVFVVPRGGVPQLIEVNDIGADDPDRGRPAWGAATTAHEGWVYLYGTAHPEQDLVFGFSLSAARVRVDDVLERERWRFWDGSSWQADESKAVALIPATGGVSQTLSVFEQNGTWYALSKRDEFVGTDLTVWTAPSPTGPFTAQEPLAQLPSDTVRGHLQYMPLAHPGILPEPGTMVVSYSRNRTDLHEVIEDPMRYRPRFLRVQLP